VLVVVAIAWFSSRDGSSQAATGAFAALLGVLEFGLLTVLLALC
ncbi:Mycobacterium numidiamassiliense ORFan, partial [Mycobacterium numidiamassiliense]